MPLRHTYSFQPLCKAGSTDLLNSTMQVMRSRAHVSRTALDRSINKPSPSLLQTGRPPVVCQSQAPLTSSAQSAISPTTKSAVEVQQQNQQQQTAERLPIQDIAQQLDALLALDNVDEAEVKAQALMEQQLQAGSLRGFGSARQVPKRIYTLEEMRLNQIEPAKLLSPQDESLNLVRNIAQGAAFAGFAALAYFQHFSSGQLLASVVAVVFAFTVDQVLNGGGGEALAVDTLGRWLQPSYGRRVALHESGHFLVAYLLGLLPRAYTLSSLDAFKRYSALNVQAGCQFCDSKFSKEVSTGRLSSSSLDRYTCVALSGVVTEFLRFGTAEGGLGDVRGLDQFFAALSFTQKKADGEVRWAVLNVADLLRRHAALHDELAAAMGRGDSVGQCIALIETRLATCDDI